MTDPDHTQDKTTGSKAKLSPLPIPQGLAMGDLQTIIVPLLAKFGIAHRLRTPDQYLNQSIFLSQLSQSPEASPTPRRFLKLANKILASVLFQSCKS